MNNCSNCFLHLCIIVISFLSTSYSQSWVKYPEPTFSYVSQFKINSKNLIFVMLEDYFQISKDSGLTYINVSNSITNFSDCKIYLGEDNEFYVSCQNNIYKLNILSLNLDFIVKFSPTNSEYYINSEGEIFTTYEKWDPKSKSISLAKYGYIGKNFINLGNELNFKIENGYFYNILDDGTVRVKVTASSNESFYISDNLNYLFLANGVRYNIDSMKFDTLKYNDVTLRNLKMINRKILISILDTTVYSSSDYGISWNKGSVLKNQSVVGLNEYEASSQDALVFRDYSNILFFSIINNNLITHLFEGSTSKTHEYYQHVDKEIYTSYKNIFYRKIGDSKFQLLTIDNLNYFINYQSDGVNAEYIYSVYDDKFYCKKTNDIHWRVLKSPYPIERITCLQVINQNTIIISYKNKIFYSNDSGQNWINLPDFLPGLPSGAYPGKKLFFQSNNGNLFLFHERLYELVGSNWNDVSKHSLGQKFILNYFMNSSGEFLYFGLNHPLDQVKEYFLCVDSSNCLEFSLIPSFYVKGNNKFMATISNFYCSDFEIFYGTNIAEKIPSGTTSKTQQEILFIDSLSYMYGRNSVSGLFKTKKPIIHATGTVNKKVNEFKVYPNIVDDRINIINPNNRQVGLKLYDQLGRCILRDIINSEGYNPIDLSHLTKGAYFIELKSNSTISSYKIIKL